jgi:hypothetical protein
MVYLVHSGELRAVAGECCRSVDGAPAPGSLSKSFLLECRDPPNYLASDQPLMGGLPPPSADICLDISDLGRRVLSNLAVRPRIMFLVSRYKDLYMSVAGSRALHTPLVR